MKYTVTITFKDGHIETEKVVDEVRAQGGFLSLTWNSVDHPQTKWFSADDISKVVQRID